MDEWMNGGMDGWMNGWMDEWMNGWMDEWMNESIAWIEWIEWMNEWVNEWRKEWRNEGINETCKLYLAKVLWRCQFCAVSMWNPALATVSCAFCRPHLPKVLASSSKSAPNVTVLYDSYMKSSSRSVSCTFGRPHLPKVLRHWQFKNTSANQALATVLCRFCRQLLLIEARSRGNRDPTSATSEATLI